MTNEFKTNALYYINLDLILKCQFIKIFCINVSKRIDFIKFSFLFCFLVLSLFMPSGSKAQVETGNFKMVAPYIGASESNDITSTNCREAALANYRDYIIHFSDRFNVSHRSRDAQRPYFRLNGRDIMGNVASPHIDKAGLGLKALPEICHNDEKDQWILYLRAIEIASKMRLMYLSMSDLELEKNPDYIKFKAERTRLISLAAQRQDINSSGLECAFNGSPDDYYCGAGLPEALYLKYSWTVSNRTDEIKCSRDFIEAWEIMKNANLLQFSTNEITGFSGYYYSSHRKCVHKLRL